MKTKLFSLFAFTFVFSSDKIFAQEGEQLFKSNCASCHTVGKGKLVGPDLKDVDTRYDEPWLLNWVKSSQTVVKSGDKIAVQLFNDNNKIPMPDVALNNDEIKSVLAYIKSKGDVTSAAPALTASSNTVENNTSTNSANSTETNENLLTSFTFAEYLMLMFIALMLVIIWVLTRAIKTLSAKITDKY